MIDYLGKKHVKNNISGPGGGGGVDLLSFFSYVGSGPASTVHPKNIRNFKHHKIIVEILAT